MNMESRNIDDVLWEAITQKSAILDAWKTHNPPQKKPWWRRLRNKLYWKIEQPFWQYIHDFSYRRGAY
jgi:hypothetical protein